jgi:hypothetical protein
MIRNVDGFKLQVRERNGLPHVLVSLSNGIVVVDTDEVSIQGLRNMASVFEAAADIAYHELDHYYASELARMRRECTAH